MKTYYKATKTLKRLVICLLKKKKMWSRNFPNMLHTTKKKWRRIWKKCTKLSSRKKNRKWIMPEKSGIVRNRGERIALITVTEGLNREDLDQMTEKMKMRKKNNNLKNKKAKIKGKRKTRPQRRSNTMMTSMNSNLKTLWP